ncbi:hypothetical protein BJY01DRAFT_260309 [Aspergillus pseudoustus]|uniref:DUF3500 domain-containing protein n=1 Tax=Aspergillus pseudoustus TaxID=1810923 RepID=A0ABR4IY10_9EURO
MRTTQNFRDVLPDLESGKFKEISAHDAHSWEAEFYKNSFAKLLTEQWLELWAQPFVGLTTDGVITPGLYNRENHEIPIQDIVATAQELINGCTAAQLRQLKFPLHARQWRSWSNPEIYISKYGLRLEEIPDSLKEIIFRIMERTVSPEGYRKLRHAMKVNAFLGDLVRGPKVLNEHSYNFLLFGDPSTTDAWGWSVYGHHLCMNVYLHRAQITIAPVFVGAEPNIVDEGPNTGIVMLDREEALGLQLMQSLPGDLKKQAQVYRDMHDERMPPGRWNEADQRHLCGAFQDNRQVAYEGLPASRLDSHQLNLLYWIVEEFIIYLPTTARRYRLEQVRQYLDETYFAWIGGFGDNDPFYYRIQSPVIVLEFDHHSGVFLDNKKPAKFHIHTIARMPNGGDYGNALRGAEDRLE